MLRTMNRFTALSFGTSAPEDSQNTRFTCEVKRNHSRQSSAHRSIASRAPFTRHASVRGFAPRRASRANPSASPRPTHRALPRARARPSHHPRPPRDASISIDRIGAFIVDESRARASQTASVRARAIAPRAFPSSTVSPSRARARRRDSLARAIERWYARDLEPRRACYDRSRDVSWAS